ncbi:MAG: acyl-CoA synthetase [Desulfobacterales bacterium]|nr:acyl-CoA synthetase [Desulfobacterales bacterium]
MLKKAADYAAVYDSFAWKIPEFYNIGVDICDKWAGQRYRLALIYENDQGRTEQYSFWDLKRLSNQLANALRAHGFGRGDRLGILLPQCPETAVAHIAAYKLGAVAVPLFTLFGPDALAYRLANCGAAAVITDAANLEKIVQIRDRLPDLRLVISTAAQAAPPVVTLRHLLHNASDHFKPVRTRADEPALIIYTSGTTGPPKGALHAHRVLLGHLPGVEFFHNFFPRKGDCYWTPADWAWIGGLIDVLLPSWHHGVPVVAHRFKKFDPEEAFFFLAKYGVRNAFMPPTALKLMRQVQHPRQRHQYALRTIGSGGETLGEALLAWGREVFGLTINEFYGQTEVNLVVGNCSQIMEARPGSMGRPIPGHTLAIVDAEGRELPAGEVGEVAVRRPDPVMFLEYWRNPQATRAKFVGDWCLTGDFGRKDEQGYLWYVGRRDDLITSAGYRMGPGEIEECLLKHPAVAMAAVIGVPDEVRGEIVKAFVVLLPGFTGDRALKEEIQQFVRTRLAAHEYPREIDFLPELPMTATGKIIRRNLRQIKTPP